MSIVAKKEKILNIDGLVQDCSISIANTLEILQSCTKPSIYISSLFSFSEEQLRPRCDKYVSSGVDLDERLACTNTNSWLAGTANSELLLKGKYSAWYKIFAKLIKFNNIKWVPNIVNAGNEIFRLWGSIPFLLMPWLLKSPVHQQAWYWLCRAINMYCC